MLYSAAMPALSTALARAAALLAAVLAMTDAGAMGTLFASPLEGRVWDVKAARFVEPAEAEGRIAAAPIALLGETHDNPDHHAIQRRVLARAVALGRAPALAMEQFDVEWQGEIDAARANDVSAVALVRAGHGSSGWVWALYEPLVSFALEHDLPIAALNLPRQAALDVSRRGFDALGAGESERLALDRTWNDARQAAMHRAIVEGHCGQDDPLVDRLVQAQRARDAVMADRILAHAQRGAIATIGRGHARRDLGVPLYLAARSPAQAVLAVGLVEVDPDIEAPTRYAEVSGAQFDLVWFTHRAAREDPCAGPVPHAMPPPAKP